ncbi:MAG: T9SS type A sorting domain-containing protein, partial [Candidatus Kapaibacterium sp.]
GAIFSTLESGRSYYWRTKAANDETESPWSETWSFRTAEDTAVGLLAPELLTPINKAAELPVDILLTWDSVDGAIFYEIEVGRDEAFDKVDTVLVVDSTSVEIAGLIEGTTYFWRGRAGMSATTSAWSKPFTFSTESAEEKLPEAPILLFPANGSTDIEGAVTLGWASAQFAAQYFVQISATGNFNGEEDQYTQLTEDLTIDELKPGVEYFWRVQGINQFGEGAWSERWSFVMKEETSSVEGEGERSSGLRLYPIPATDILYIDLDSEVGGEVKVELMNSLGEKIQTEGSRERGNNRFVLSLDGIPSGMLFCRIQTEEGTITRPVVVIR